MKEAEDEAWRELVRRVGPRLVTIGRRLGVPEADVEDEVQAVWLGLVERGETVRNREAWAVATMRQRCRDRRRRRWARSRSRRSLPRAEWIAPPELRVDLYQAWRSLRLRHRRLLWCRYVEGMTEPEAAHLCGYRVGSARQITKRVLDRLRRLLGVGRGTGEGSDRRGPAGA